MRVCHEGGVGQGRALGKVGKQVPLWNLGWGLMEGLPYLHPAPLTATVIESRTILTNNSTYIVIATSEF